MIGSGGQSFSDLQDDFQVENRTSSSSGIQNSSYGLVPPLSPIAQAVDVGNFPLKDSSLM